MVHNRNELRVKRLFHWGQWQSWLAAAGILLITSCAQAGEQRHAINAARRIQSTTSIVVHVPARSKWTPTGILVQKGDIYRFESLPPNKWYDFFYPAPATGYGSLSVVQSWSEPKRRVPDANWFVLCGSIERSGPAFNIWSVDRKPLKANGQLGLFPNDTPNAYWNNCGELRVRITRVR